MKLKLIKHFINNKLYYLTFLVGLIVVSMMYIVQQIAPFGNKSMLTIDLYHQYGPLLGELYDRVTNGSSLIYSFSMGMGLPFLSNFMNILSSPFNLLLFLFKREHLVMGFALIIGLKVIGAMVSMVYYLSKKFRDQGLALIPFGLLYGLCAWLIAYYWNIMYLDGLMMLPLIIWGIEKLVNEEKWTFYLVTLVIMLFANYYMAYMICLFSSIYFLVYLFLSSEHFKIKLIGKKCLIFAGTSLLAAGLIAIVLVPLYLSLKVTSATTGDWPTAPSYFFTFWEFLASHFTGVGRTVFRTDITNAPNIACGVLSIGLFLFFIINPQIKLKVKISYLFLLGFLVISFFCKPLDFIWHGFHVPNDVPYRYSFIYSFIFLIMGVYTLMNIKALKIKTVCFVYLFLLLAVSLLKVFNYHNISNLMVTLNQVFLSIYFIIYLLYKLYPRGKIMLTYSLILVVMVECVVVFYNNSYHAIPVSLLYDNYESIKTTIADIKQHDNDIYRLEKAGGVTYNDSAWYGYYGITGFSSMNYQGIAELHDALGLQSNGWYSYYYRQTTPVYDFMFDIKYFLGESRDMSRYHLLSDYQLPVYQANYTASLMYAVNAELKAWEVNDNPFVIQNDYIEKATGIKEVFIPIKCVNKTVLYAENELTLIKYDFKNPGDNIYFYLEAENIDHFILNNTLYYSINPYSDLSATFPELTVKHYEEYYNYMGTYLISTTLKEKSFSIYIVYHEYQDDIYELYTINHEQFEKAATLLQAEPVHINEFKEHYIKGKVILSEPRLIYTSIPYDRGWRVIVDGELVETFKIGGALLGFDLKAGEHEIVLRYLPQGLLTGSLISLGSLMLVIIIYYQKSRSRRFYKD